MAKEREILTYEFDISDVEAKVARLKMLQEEIAAKRKEGVDSSGLEQEFMREVDGLTRVTRQQDEAAGSAEELTRQKEKLANVVQLLGGRFGPVVGQLGDVVELLMAGGPAAAGFAGAMAGLTGVVAVIAHIRREMEAANEQMREFIDARREMVEGERTPAERIERALLGMGALEAGRAEQVYAFGKGLQTEFGLPEELAMSVAPVAQVAGVGAEDAALMALASVAPGGQMPRTPEEFRAALGRMSGEQRGALQQQLVALRGSAMGQRSVGTSALESALMEEEPGRAAALFAPGRDALIVEFAKQIGVAPEKAGPESLDKWLNKLKELRARRRQLEMGMEPSGAPEADVGDLYSPAAMAALDTQIALYERLERALQLLEEKLPGPDGAAPAGGNTTYNVGTIFNAPDSRNPGRGRVVRMTPGGSDVRSPMP